MKLSPRNFFTVQLLACSLMWSSGFLFMKLLADTVDPFAIASVRATFAAIILAGWFLMRGLSPLPARFELVPWLILGTLNGWLPNVLTAYALQSAGAGPSAMIQASGPLMVAVLSHFAFLDERLTARKVIGIAVGFAGMLVLIGPSELDHQGASLFGALAMVVVSVCYAVGNVYAKFIPHVEPSRMALGQPLAATGLTFALSGTAAYAPIVPSWPAALGLSLFSTALPITIFMYMIRQQGPTKAAMIGYLMPTFATILAVIFLGEAIGVREVIGGLVVLAGVFVVTTAPRAMSA
ncbi:MAG: DMT family transporter [Alphaproteobacteria bacterium]|nr:DMT family transporter [Alphaproteobacteria bacterium]